MIITGDITPEKAKVLSRKAFPIECSAAHGVDNPQCKLLGTVEEGIYVYEYYEENGPRYWYKEYVKENGKLIPYDEYVFGPIRAKAKANKARQEMLENQLSPEQERQRQDDLNALRLRFRK